MKKASELLPTIYAILAGIAIGCIVYFLLDMIPFFAEKTTEKAKTELIDKRN